VSKRRPKHKADVGVKWRRKKKESVKLKLNMSDSLSWNRNNRRKRNAVVGYVRVPTVFSSQTVVEFNIFSKKSVSCSVFCSMH
jgi:hypothetical protein